jgi:replicative DNA helicase
VSAVDESRLGGPVRGRWDVPVPLDDSGPLPAFPVDALPETLGGYVACVAEATQVPADLPGVLVLAACAAAAGGRVVVEPRAGWIEPTNIFAAVTLAPGNRKSAVFEMVCRPLRLAERAAIDAAEQSIAAAEVDRSVAEARAKDAARVAGRALDKGDENADALLQAARDFALMADAIRVPARPRLLIDDSTPEALTSILATQAGRGAVMSAEGGVFDQIAGRYSKFPSFDVYLKGHAGDELRVDRVGRKPEYIERPALTVGLAIQPAVLRQIADREGFRGRGLLARFLFSLPVSFVGSRRIGAPAVPADVRERYESEMKALVLSLTEWTDPAILRFTPEANEALLEYERRLEPKLGRGGTLEHVADWGSKLAGAVVRIAGLLHLAANLRSGVREPITADTFQRAASIGDYFLAHAVAVHRFMGADPILEDARAIRDWFTARDIHHFTKREAHRALTARFRKSSELDSPLVVLEDLGWIRRRPDPPNRPEGGRPPSPTYDVHPDTTHRTDKTRTRNG